MWRSKSFRRNLLQLFDSPSRRPDLNHTSFLGLAGASSVCPSRSLFFARALKYSSKAAPFSEHPYVFGGPRRGRIYDLIFIKRMVPEDVVGGIGLGTTEPMSQEDVVLDIGPDFSLLTLLPMPLHDDRAEYFTQFSLEVCSNQTLTLNTRYEAVEIIFRLAKFCPDSLEKYELVNPILQVMLPLLAPEEGSFKHSPHSAAWLVLETMASNHPEQVFSFVLEFASLSSQNTNLAVLALGDIAKVCPQLVKDKLEPLLGIILGARQDAEELWVRQYVSSALCSFAKHLQPEITTRCQAVLPCILNALDEDYGFLEGISYDSLEALCDNMTREEILPFLDPIMNKLLPKLQCGSYGLMQKRCIDVMCSVAAAAGQDFVLYAERVLESMKQLLVLTSTEGHFLRTQDLVFAGVLATTVGRARVEPMLTPYIKAAISATANSRNEIPCRHRRRYTYGFFCNVAETLGDGFAKYLPDVVRLAISSCNLDDDSETRSCFHRTELLDEKAAATQALGLFAIHTKSAYAPYLEESMSVMINHSTHYHEDVRLQGVIGLKNVLTAAQAVFESHSDGATKAKKVLGTVMDHYIKAMDEDGDKRVVAQVCANVVGILEDFRYAALEPYMPQIIDSALRLLQGQSACQRADGAEHDEILMAAVSNLLPALAKAATTSHFILSMFSMLSDALIKLSAAPGSSRYRTMAAAIHAEVANLDAPFCAHDDII